MTNNQTNFRLYYDSLPANTQKGFISLVCQSCDISEPTFYRWLNNPEQIKKPAREKIAQIAAKPENEIFNLEIV